MLLLLGLMLLLLPPLPSLLLPPLPPLPSPLPPPPSAPCLGAGEGIVLLLSCCRAHMEAYSPPAATRAAWLPHSTTWPWASTRIWSASMIVLSL